MQKKRWLCCMRKTQITSKLTRNANSKANKTVRNLITKFHSMHILVQFVLDMKNSNITFRKIAIILIVCQINYVVYHVVAVYHQRIVFLMLCLFLTTNCCQPYNKCENNVEQVLIMEIHSYFNQQQEKKTHYINSFDSKKQDMKTRVCFFMQIMKETRKDEKS